MRGRRRGRGGSRLSIAHSSNQASETVSVQQPMPRRLRLLISVIIFLHNQRMPLSSAKAKALFAQRHSAHPHRCRHTLISRLISSLLASYRRHITHGYHTGQLTAIAQSAPIRLPDQATPPIPVCRTYHPTHRRRRNANHPSRCTTCRKEL